MSNTYLLLFNDESNLRTALKTFAGVFFDDTPQTQERIRREIHPDCLIFPDAGKSPDKEMTERVIEESYLSPTEGGKKLFVLDNMHKANATAQNKLLKILEEPPKNVYFLLGATTSFPLLSTVLSRAEKLEIPPFTDEQIEETFNRKYPDRRQENRAYAQAADGVVGRAEKLLLGGKYDELTRLALNCIEATHAQIPATTRALNAVLDKGEFVALVKRFYRDILFLKTGQDYVKDIENGARLQALAKTLKTKTLVFALDTLTEAEKQLTFNANLCQCMEVALYKIYKENQQ